MTVLPVESHIFGDTSLQQLTHSSHTSSRRAFAIVSLDSVVSWEEGGEILRHRTVLSKLKACISGPQS